MASIEHRQSRTGTHWRVVWRQQGAKQTERFPTENAAVKFRQQVEAAGNQWPFGWTPGYGFGAPEEAAPAEPVMVTFAEFARATVKARSTANARTRADYLRDLERHVFPTFGTLPVDAIGRHQVGAWVIELRGAVSPKTAKNVQGLASSVMDEAVAAQLSPMNPFKGALGQLPAAKHEEMTFLTRPEFDLLLDCLAAPRYRPLTRLLAMTGLRWSEATAVPVHQVDLGRRKVTVVRAWKRTPENFFELGEPKSRRSRRTVSIPPSLADDLAPLVEGRDPAELLFTTRDGHPVRHSNYYSRVWVPTVRRANERGLAKKPRIHDLRHSHASWLIAAGWSLPAIQRRLGHESITTTVDRYGHLEDAYDDAIALALDEPAKAGDDLDR